jgi:hypothetical protein
MELMTIDSKEEETAFLNLINAKGENFSFAMKAAPVKSAMNIF